MIEQIDLTNRIPFTEGKNTIENLRKVNFFFGPNGSGKTTISRIIRQDELGSEGSVSWANGQPVKVYVYNRDFIAENLLNDDIPGVFTIGADSVDAQKAIDTLKNALDQEERSIAKDRANLDTNQTEYLKKMGKLEERCWEIKKGLPEVFGTALKGSLSGKKVFTEQVMTNISKLNDESESDLEIKSLEKRSTVIFDGSIGKMATLPSLDLETISALESNELMATAIVGKESVPIAALITQLNNGDWVLSGREYIKDTTCPFCQQATITEEFKSQLEEFFDESYRKNLNELNNLKDKYEHATKNLINQLNSIVDSHPELESISELKQNLGMFEEKVRSNLLILTAKLAEPSRILSLEDTGTIRDDISEILKQIDESISEHNTLVDSRVIQKQSLIKDIWAYIANTAREQNSDLLDEISKLEKTVVGLKESVEEHEAKKEIIESEISLKERSITNVRETAEAINDILKRFGFTSFHIEVNQDANHYQICRSNGQSATKTLSEGESGFLAFLYFYHLMSGSQEATGISERRVVVIDDPVSSMDADALFIVSTLVRSLAQEARGGQGPVIQLIVLTHNITFHHEITHIKEREGNRSTSFYRIKKLENCSTVEECEKNPISTGYDMLWQELYEEECRPISAQNASRRIIETFFSFIGEANMDKALDKMTGPESEIARSFWSWANAGSHRVFDDETFLNTDETTETYRNVLESIFIDLGYEAHLFNMKSKFTN